MRNKDEKEKYIVRHKCKSFQVMIWHNGKNHYIGLYSTIEEAIKERDNFLKINAIKNTSRTNESHYVENKEMMYEMIISKEMGILSPKLLKMCMKIVSGVNKKFRYKDEDDRADVIAYSYEIIIKNWYHFDLDKYNNVFAYITEIVKRAHAFQWKQLQRNRLNTISLDYINEEGNKIFNI
jgi:hypothetical protein